jgi:hypothetical protein
MKKFLRRWRYLAAKLPPAVSRTVNSLTSHKQPLMKPQADAREAERNLLAVEALSRSGSLRLRVRGESMLPTLWPGDEVEIAGCSPAEIQRGDVLLAFYGDRFFLHRAWRFSDNGDVITRGDSLPKPDPAVPVQAIVGRLTRVTRAGRSLPVSRRSSPIRRAFGIVLCYSGLTRRIALRLHGWRVKKIKIENRQRPQIDFCNLGAVLNREPQ